MCGQQTLRSLAIAPAVHAALLLRCCYSHAVAVYAVCSYPAWWCFDGAMALFWFRRGLDNGFPVVDNAVLIMMLLLLLLLAG
jgi:hypothetical protein